MKPQPDVQKPDRVLKPAPAIPFVLKYPIKKVPINSFTFQQDANTPIDMMQYPNDSVQLDLYNAIDDYLATDYRIPEVQIKPAFKAKGVIIDLHVERDIQRLDYLAGQYNVRYRFNRNLLGSGDGHRVQVQEISANGLEIRVRAVMSPTLNNTAYLEQFQSGLFEIPKANTLTNLFLHKDQITSAQVFDYVQDKFTLNSAPYSIIFKLTGPAPPSIVVGDQLWLAQSLSPDFTDSIVVTPPDITPPLAHISGPNFDVLTKRISNKSTNYKDNDDLVTTDITVSNELKSRLMSSSFMEGIELNIDYRTYENYVQFSSAETRLRNFQTKLKRIETDTALIAALGTD
ncbi:MAG: hypothetical protein QF535_02220, partial [Anaerolineales bacterium]|nr:hypothetical protein [Anaerolineales bacterium]